jgi:diguanylate cyclase (GGDEF)-like protein
MKEESGVKLTLDDKLLRRIEACTNLPSPPVVAMRVIELSQDPDVDIGKVADVISMDPALTAKILRISNSPIYALRRKAESVQQAITLLGLNGTLILALSFSLAATMNNNASQGFDYNAFWRRSLAAATCCRRIGMGTRLRKSEELFLAGLLQDIGMLVIDKMDPEFYGKLGVDQKYHRQLYNGEKDILGADHAVIGGWILEKWGLPATLIEGVECSHNPDIVADDTVIQSFKRCIALSGMLVDAVHGQDEGHALQEIASRIKMELDIDDGEFDSMMESLDVDFHEAADLFDTDLSDYSFSDALLDRAKEALIIKNVESLQQADRLQATAEVLESKTQILEERTRRDGLTGLFNRAYLDERMSEEFTMARKRDWSMVIMFVDLDHFKRVNDTYGHQAGDQVLKGAARALVNGTRDEDVVARYGGEEFLVIAPGQGETTANIIAERLVGMFKGLTHTLGGGNSIVVTASVGVAVLGDGNDFASAQEMIEAADKALYVAKESGRNRYVIYSDCMEKEQVPKSGTA